MKSLMKTGFLHSAVILVMLFLTQTIAWAQDTTSTATTTTRTTTENQTWYVQPWVWIVGGAVLILIIVALVRGNSSGSQHTDKVTVTKTRTTDNS